MARRWKCPECGAGVNAPERMHVGPDYTPEPSGVSYHDLDRAIARDLANAGID